MQIPRSRGAVSGTLLVLLGVWGTFIPFVGPYFDYAYAPDKAWDFTTGRLLLEILPGVGAVLGGLLVLGSANRVSATLGGWIAALSGSWFVLGVPLSTIWTGPTVGAPIGSTTRQALEYVGFFGGLGVVIVLLAAFALGRFAVVGVREVEHAMQAAPAEENMTTPHEGALEPDQEEAAGQHRFRWSKHAGAH